MQFKGFSSPGIAQEVIPSGFEPETDRLEICCSIQLSYGTIAMFFAVQICKYLGKQAIGFPF